MPVAVPFIVGAVATELAVAAEIVVAGSLGASLIGGAASLAASFAVRSLTSDEVADPGVSLSAAGAGRTQQFRQPIAPHQVVAGRIKTSGPILFVTSGPDDDDRPNGYIYLIHALAGHQSRAISDIFLDDNLSTDSRYSGLVTINLHTGEDDQTADTTFTTDIPSDWTTDHRLRGITYLASRLKFDANAFTNGLPNISAIVEGVADITDFRDDTVRWTNNPALFIAWWMMSPLGMNLQESDLDLDSVIAAANVCDERVRVLSALDSSPPGADTTATVDSGSPDTNSLTLADGARDLDYGYGVRVANNLPTGLSADTTYYVIPLAHNRIQLASSHINAIDRIPITLGDNVGEISVYYWDEPRYLINGQFTVDQSRIDILQGMLSAMAGVAVYVGGKWFIHAGTAAIPSVILSEDDLRGPMTMTPKRSMRDRFNAVRAVYVSPDANWQPVDAPPLFDASAHWSPRQYEITVGAGGPAENVLPDQPTTDHDGEDSIFDTIVAAGGGGGGDFKDGPTNAGQAGGSGGGGGSEATSPFTGHSGGAGNTPSTSPPQGNAGGNGDTVSGGGGGGAGAAGGNASTDDNGGDGGDGVASSITGVSVTRAGGGGGAGEFNPGEGGTGGGGNGAQSEVASTAGEPNTGGGGGGGAQLPSSAGGSGIVILRYPTGEIEATGGTITTDGAYTIHTFTSSGNFEVQSGSTLVWYLVIGGGGGGALGGGGAGGYRENGAYDHAVSAIEEDGLYRDLRFPFTTSGRAVQRLMKIELERNLRERVIQFPAKLTAFRLLPWDGMYLSYERYGFELEQHRVIGWALAEDGGVDLTLQADDSDVYAWDRLTDEKAIAATQEVAVPDGSISPPTVLVDLPPSTYSGVTAFWTPDPLGAVSFDAYYRESLASPADWVFFGRIPATGLTQFTAPGINVAIDFHVRSVGSSGQTSAFGDNIAPGAPIGAAFALGAITWTDGTDTANVQVFFNNVSDDLSGASVEATVPGGTETYTPAGVGYYWLRSLNATNNVSAATDPITVS